MKKIITFLCISAIAAPGIAQPVLNYSSSHSIGTQSTMYMIGGTPAALQQSGAAVVWDLSSSTVTQIGTYKAVDPSTTPYGSSYPSANLAFEQNITTQGTTYTYLIDSPTELSSIADGIGGTNPTTWASHDKLMEYPFNYNDFFTATRQSATGSPEAYTRTYDAYGTLIVNGKTYNDVIRISKNPGNAIWFTTSPVMFPVIIQASSSVYLYNEPTTFTGTAESATKDQVTVYPNPASDKLFIDGLDDLSTINCYDALGQSVKIKRDGKSLDLTGLERGVYFLQITTGSVTLHHRFVKN